jgi:hypothetical protein
MRSLLVAATLILTTPAFAAAADALPPSPPPAHKGTASAAVTVHYPSLEKMLRRFSREAGTPRTRG